MKPFTNLPYFTKGRRYFQAQLICESNQHMDSFSIQIITDVFNTYMVSVTTISVSLQ
jgi:hypothetical protein